MTLYRYKAVSADGEAIDGEMEAESRSAVGRKLQELGHFPIRADEVTEAQGQTWLNRDLFGGRRVSRKAVTLMTRELATLVGAGLPLERALEILADLAGKEAPRKLMTQILAGIRAGASLSDTLAAQGDTFPKYYVSLVRAGEMAGALDTVLTRLAEYLEKSEALAEEVKSALVYPILLLAMTGISIAVLMTFVVPGFKPLFEDAGSALPLPTQVVVAVSDFFAAYWWAMIVAAVSGWWLLRQQLRNPQFRAHWDRAYLGVPLLGDLERKVEVARFARTLGTLIGNGVTLLSGLGIVRQSMSNLAMAQAIEDVVARLKEGGRLAELLSNAKVFPDLALYLVRVGEETGQLESMLQRIADIYDREVQVTVNRLLSLLVPVLTIGLGVLIAGIITSVLVALLSINELVF